MENSSDNPKLEESKKDTLEKQPVVSPTISGPLKSKLPIVLIIIFLIFLFGFGGILLGKSLSEPKNIFLPTALTPKPTEIPTATPDATTNWKTYTQRKAKYLIKYPPSWFVTDGTISNVKSPLPEKNTIVINFYPTDTTITNLDTLLDTILKDFRSMEGDPAFTSYESKTNTTVAGYPALKVSGNGYGGKYLSYLVIDVNNKSNAHISISYQEGNLENFQSVIDQILSTFKFLDQNQPSDTSNWKIYEGVTAYSGKFSIKYPSSWALKRMEGGVGKGDLLFPLGDINADIINYKAPYILLGTGGHGGGCEKQTRTFTAGKAEYCWGEFGGMAIFEKNEAPYILEAYYYGDPQAYTNEQYKIVFEQILSTFKFLD